MLQREKYRSPRLAERSWRRPATSATGTQSSERYCGAKPCRCRHLYTVTHSLKVTRCGTSNQRSSSWRMCVKPRSNFRVPVMTRAGAFTTRCSLSVVVLGAFEYFLSYSMCLLELVYSTCITLHLLKLNSICHLPFIR